ncbi:hypothetical protein GCM10017562_45660 [Streptomyces roseofulvus]
MRATGNCSREPRKASPRENDEANTHNKPEAYPRSPDRVKTRPADEPVRSRARSVCVSSPCPTPPSRASPPPVVRRPGQRARSTLRSSRTGSVDPALAPPSHGSDPGGLPGFGRLRRTPSVGPRPSGQRARSTLRSSHTGSVVSRTMPSEPKTR